jgi:hypothetical protein
LVLFWKTTNSRNGINQFPLVLSLFRLNEKRGESHSLESGMLLLLLSLFKAAKACDLVTLPTDDGVSIGFESRKVSIGFESRRVWVTGKLTFFVGI